MSIYEYLFLLAIYIHVCIPGTTGRMAGGGGSNFLIKIGSRPDAEL